MTSDILELAHFWPRSGQVGTARCYAFQCADILELNQQTVAAARGAKSYFFAVTNGDDEPLALFPLSIERRKLIRVLTFVDGGLSNYNAPVVFPPICEWEAGDIVSVWSALQRILQPDLVKLEKVPNVIGDLPNPLKYLHLSAEGISAHTMSLSGTWEGLSVRLPKRSTLKRASVGLGKIGTVKFDLAETVDQYDQFVEAMIGQKTSRYLETSGIDGMDRPGYRKFLRAARNMIHPSGPICLFALKINDVILATVWGCISDARFYALFSSFDGEWRKYSAGHLLIRQVIEWCFSNGIRLFDFGTGDQDYKQDYCDTTDALYRIDIPSSICGKLYLHARNTKQLLAG